MRAACPRCAELEQEIASLRQRIEVLGAELATNRAWTIRIERLPIRGLRKWSAAMPTAAPIINELALRDRAPSILSVRGSLGGRAGALPGPLAVGGHFVTLGMHASV
jgi:hypothetical protein